MKTNKNIYNMCREFISSEISEFDHNPKGYIESFGWDINVKKFKNIEQLKGEINFKNSDIKNLHNSLLKIENEGIVKESNTIEIYENSKFNSLLNNWMATQILKHLK